MPTVAEIVKKTTDFLGAKGSDSPRLDSELLISYALGWERLQVFLKFDYPLNEKELDKCRDLVRRRSAGEPVAYLIGKKGFYEHVFEVNEHTLIPRPESEKLVENAIAFFEHYYSRKNGEHIEPLIMDLGCGSGCLGLSVLAKLKSENKTAKAVFVDISREALEVTKRNADNLGVSELVQFLNLDAGEIENFHEYHETVDVVLANPPYIDPSDTRVSDGVRKYEPARALYAGEPGENGLTEIRRWSAVSARLCKSEFSCAIFEIGDQQGKSALDIFSNYEWGDINLEKDLSGHDRIIMAQRGINNG